MNKFLPILLCICLPTFAQYRHVSLDGSSPVPLPKKVLVIPAEVTVQELSAGGLLTKIPEATDKASANLSLAARRYLESSKSLQVVSVPDQLSEESKEQLEDYLATFFVVGLTAFNVTAAGGSAWQHKRKEFDYSLGQGLSFLREKTGADAALMIVGDDVVASGGRKTAAVLGALVGVVVPMGRSIIFVAMVDLKTGDLLWINSVGSGMKDLSDESSASTMVGDLLAPYPAAKQ